MRVRAGKGYILTVVADLSITKRSACQCRGVLAKVKRKEVGYREGIREKLEVIKAGPENFILSGILDLE